MLRCLFLSLCLLTPLPALAQGSISLSLSPRTAAEADGLRFALQLYALHQGIRAGTNLGIIDQRGSGHDAQLRQRGVNHAYGIFQSGRNTQARVQQSGRGAVGLLLQHGW